MCSDEFESAVFTENVVFVALRGSSQPAVFDKCTAHHRTFLLGNRFSKDHLAAALSAPPRKTEARAVNVHLTIGEDLPKAIFTKLYLDRIPNVLSGVGNNGKPILQLINR